MLSFDVERPREDQGAGYMEDLMKQIIASIRVCMCVNSFRKMVYIKFVEN